MKIFESIVLDINSPTYVYLFTNPITNGLYVDRKSNGLLACETEGVANIFKSIFSSLKNSEIEMASYDDAIVYSNNLSDGKITMITLDKLKSVRYNNAS
jgi:hypothetical protein